MTHSRAVLQQSVQLLRKDLAADEFPDADMSLPDPLAELHKNLTRWVSHMLDRDFGSLLNALYRIDLPEEKVKQLLAVAPPESLAADMAHMILNRQIQKAELRQRYSSL
jgi:hypothetical protein